MTSGEILYTQWKGRHVFRLVGDIRTTGPAGIKGATAFDQAIESLFNNGKPAPVMLDLRKTTAIDSTFLGLLAKIAVKMREHDGKTVVLVCDQQNILDVLHGMALNTLFTMVEDSAAPPEKDGAEIGPSSAEKDAKAVVLDAHKTLADLSDDNEAAFSQLIRLLEEQP